MHLPQTSVGRAVIRDTALASCCALSCVPSRSAVLLCFLSSCDQVTLHHTQLVCRQRAARAATQLNTEEHTGKQTTPSPRHQQRHTPTPQLSYKGKQQRLLTAGQICAAQHKRNVQQARQIARCNATLKRRAMRTLTVVAQEGDAKAQAADRPCEEQRARESNVNLEPGKDAAACGLVPKESSMYVSVRTIVYGRPAGDVVIEQA